VVDRMTDLLTTSPARRLGEIVRRGTSAASEIADKFLLCTALPFFNLTRSFGLIPKYRILPSPPRGCEIPEIR